MPVQINFQANDKQAAKLDELARQRGVSRTGYAKLLFDAAFASRVGVQPDVDIDDQIRIAIVMHGARTDTATISKACGLSEATVIKVIDAWRKERLCA